MRRKWKNSKFQQICSLNSCQVKCCFFPCTLWVRYFLSNATCNRLTERKKKAKCAIESRTQEEEKRKKVQLVILFSLSYSFFFLSSTLPVYFIFLHDRKNFSQRRMCVQSISQLALHWIVQMEMYFACESFLFLFLLLFPSLVLLFFFCHMQSGSHDELFSVRWRTHARNSRETSHSLLSLSLSLLVTLHAISCTQFSF